MKTPRALPAPLDLMHHRPAALAVARFLPNGNNGKPMDNTSGQRMAKRLNLRLSTLSIGNLVPSPAIVPLAIREWCQSPPAPPLCLDDLPVGPDEATVPGDDVQGVYGLLAEVAS